MNKEDRIEKFRTLMCKKLNFRKVETLIDRLDKIGFFTAPASVKFHGNYEGGLFDHSYAVTEALLELTKNLHLSWSNRYSPYIIGMFHDLCECDNYIKNEDGSYSYANNLTLIGHGEKSVIIAQQIYGKLSEEEILCIRWHMGAYDDSKVWNNLGAAMEKYPNVLWTHTADMMAARLRGV